MDCNGLGFSKKGKRRLLKRDVLRSIRLHHFQLQRLSNQETVLKFKNTGCKDSIKRRTYGENINRSGGGLNF